MEQFSVLCDDDDEPTVLAGVEVRARVRGYTLSFWTPFEAPSNSKRNGKRVEFDDWAFECESSSVFDGKSRGRHRGGMAWGYL